MTEQLIEIATGKLLEKFGAGNHKPGSGSASAFQGMLAAQMLRTVIDLTVELKHKKAYEKYIHQLFKIEKEIEERVYPALEGFFQLDSDQFDNVIKLRSKRDQETDWKKKRDLSALAQEALITSTETPLKIAEFCVELGGFAEYVFNYGFQSARGDSGVALNCAISGIASCLSIVELNLITLPINERTEAIRKRKAGIKSDYEKISKSITNSLAILENEAVQNRDFLESIDEFQKGNLADSVESNLEIENIVRQLQNTIWLKRKNIWKNKTIETPLDVLKAEVTLEKVMGYTCQRLSSLGTYEQDGDSFEIAGLINKKEKLIQISNHFPEETQNFTAAHELGHAILHRQTVLHRDRPLDGSSAVSRNREELQADKFATFFLMPAKLVENIFLEMYKTPKFLINEASALAIRGGSIDMLKRRCQDKRGLARLLSTTEFYGDRSFNSLAKIFKVSTETMAIRLEELDLLDF